MPIDWTSSASRSIGIRLHLADGSVDAADASHSLYYGYGAEMIGETPCDDDDVDGGEL